MSKAAETRKIISGVVLAQTGQCYVDGMEDELEQEMTPEQRDYLLAEGAILGEWKAEGDAEWKMATAPKDKRTPVRRGRELAAFELTSVSETAEADAKTAAGHKQVVTEAKPKKKPATHRPAPEKARGKPGGAPPPPRAAPVK